MRYVTPTLLILVLVVGATSRADTPRKDRPMEEVVRGNTRFALDLHSRLRPGSGNLFLSPYSLSTALAMTYAGARGETATQMARTLHFDVPGERLHAAFAELARRIIGEGQSRPYKLSVANSLWGQEGTRFLPGFLQVMADDYGAGLRQVDFRSAELTCRTINAWVEEQTGGKIKDLIQPSYITSLTRLVLTNAIYFKGEWANPFPKGSTKDETFLATGDGRVTVPMMRQVGRFNYLEGDTFQALELPYASDDLSMIVLLPRAADGLATLEESMTPNRLDTWLADLQSHRVDVALPRFKIEARFELRGVLPAMGMPDAFDRDRADFSGMTGGRDLYISAVIHKAFVEVNEEGTEAAAATGVVMALRAVRPEPVASFRADHPFSFLIRDRRTGSLLFMGRVANPKG